MSRLKLWLGLIVLTVIALAVGIALSSNSPAQSTNINSGPSFTYVVSNGTFTFSAVGGYADYVWRFGDGSTGSGAVVSHTYEANGNYTVTLTASPLSGSPASMSTYQQIVVDSVLQIVHHYFENLNITMGNAAS